MAEPTGVEAPIEGAEYSEEFPAEYTTESPETSVSEFEERVPHPEHGFGSGTGRRKQAIARVRIVPGSGKWRINDKSIEGFFPNKVHQQVVREPLTTLGNEEGFDVIARVHGGGPSGQAGAMRLGIARALGEIDPESRPELKKAGFLTRDARAKERKKYGLKKARKAPQYSKR